MFSAPPPIPPESESCSTDMDFTEGGLKRSAIAEEIRSLKSRRREPATHFQRFGGALGLIRSPVGPRRMTEPAAKFSGEMSIVAEAAIVGNLAERLACVQQRPAMQETCGMIQTNRMYEMSAGRIPRRKELLKVAQRDPSFGRYLARTEVRIGKAILYDTGEACEQLVGMRGDNRQIGLRK